MFNRALQVRMVKNPRAEAEKEDTTENLYEGKAAIIAYTTDRVVKKVAVAALVYVVLDTARQVLVTRAAK